MICFLELRGWTSHKPAELHFQQRNPRGKSGIAIASLDARSSWLPNRFDWQAGNCVAVRHSRRNRLGRFIEYRRGQSASWRRRCGTLLTGRYRCFLPVASLAAVSATSAAPSPAFLINRGRRRSVPQTFCRLLDFAAHRYRRFQCFWILFKWQFCLRLRNRRRRQSKLARWRSPRFQRDFTWRAAQTHGRFLRLHFPIRAPKSLRCCGIPFGGIGILSGSFEILRELERYHGIPRFLVKIR